MQILILGMHRSGTSMVTRLVNMMGAYVGAEKTALEHQLGGMDPNNAKGHWERADVIQLNDVLLKLRNCTWRNLAKWQDKTTIAVPTDIHRAMQLLVLDMDAHRPWVMKDPRLCITLSDWLPLVEIPIAIIVYRDPHEIALSLHRRNAIPVEYGLALWEFYTVMLLNASVSIPRIFCRYQDGLSSPQAFVEKLYHKLVNESVVGLRMPSAREIRAFIDPHMQRIHSPEPHTLPPLNANQQQLVLLMQETRTQEGLLTVSSESTTILKLA